MLLLLLLLAAARRPLQRALIEATSTEVFGPYGEPSCPIAETWDDLDRGGPWGFGPGTHFFPVPQRTRVRILATCLYSYQVRVLDGPAAGRTGFVAADWLPITAYGRHTERDLLLASIGRK